MEVNVVIIWASLCLLYNVDSSFNSEYFKCLEIKSFKVQTFLSENLQLKRVDLYGWLIDLKLRDQISQGTNFFLVQKLEESLAAQKSLLRMDRSEVERSNLSKVQKRSNLSRCKLLFWVQNLKKSLQHKIFDPYGPLIDPELKWICLNINNY